MDTSLQTKYTSKTLAKTIDQSLLRPNQTTTDFKEQAEDAKKLGYRSLCVHPSRLLMTKNLLSGTTTKVAVVSDFPHGRGLTQIRTQEVKELFRLGADEVDIVAKYERLREGDYKTFEEDIDAMIKAANNEVIKFILEVDELSIEKIKDATRIIAEIVQYEKANNVVIKTKTGFVESRMDNKVAVKAIKEVLEKMNLYAKDENEMAKGKICIKASGGMKTREDAIEMLELGAHILGTSSGGKICS